MSTVIPVSADWLTLRESADADSRSRLLALRAGRMLRPPLVVHDLGSGTGSMVRWCAPLLPGPQTWVLHDWNEALLDHAARASARDRDGATVTMRTRIGELGDLRENDLVGASLVTASALLDVLTAGEVGAIVAACLAAAAPVLLALSVTGRVTIDPVDAGDRVFEAAFNDHQRRTGGDRTLLGPDAAPAVAELFRSAGWSVRVDESSWRLDARSRALIEEWIDGWLGAGVAQRPALGEWATEYARARSAQIAADGLRVVVHHVDLLAWPP
ncbi:SAM-dependent methyltransferase [Microbacterium sulfonylureivorans]|uniref:SAM-dependent methyltransferase n=1 Tax=Microbacterium sulfonylureivorans TaxID=2486854 RepID=UPI000FDC3B52|nr:SAM-dependent methyltransferase [Microbacterium sulfonylureivorans]